MSERSPTPWFVHDFTEVPDFTDPLPVDVTISCDHPATITVASMDRGMTATLEEARANAAFIVHAVNLHDEMVEALREAQSALAMLTDPKVIGSTTASAAWATAVAAEVKCRSALSKSAPTQGD